MTKELFYQYDFYTLEQKYAENEFVKVLDNEPIIINAIESFIQNIVDLLFVSIKENKSIELSNVAIPQVDIDFEDLLKGDPLYDIYIESNSGNSLSEVVFNKFLGRIFKKDGFNGERYIVQNYIHAWLEKRLALEIVKDLRFNSVNILVSLIDKTEMLNIFYVCLVENIPQDWVQNNRDWVNVNDNPENILDSIRTFDKPYFNNYINLFNSADKTNLWNFICETTRGSDCAMLNNEFSFRSSVLIKNDISLWIEFWDNLQLPIIQDCAFYSFLYFKPKHYLKLVNVLASEKIKVKSDLNILLFIVAKKYFETSYKLTQRLFFYEDKNGMKVENKYFFEKGQKYHKEWLKEKPDYYKKLIKDLQIRLSNADIEDWIFSYKPRIINNSYKPNEIYNSEINILTNVYKSYCTQLVDFNLQSFNLQKFNFYVQVVRDSEDKHLAVNLLEIIVDFIASDKFLWDKSYSEPYWSSIKGIGYLISLDSDPIQKAKEIIDEFKINHQGWNSLEIGFKSLTKESFIYSGIALLFEHNSFFKSNLQIEFFFKDFLNTVLIQNRYSQIDNSEYYQQPLHLLFLVANQIFSNLKEYFEQKIIENYDNLYSLLSILSNDQETICDQSKVLLKERLNNEFYIEKRKISNLNQNDKVKKMRNMIKSLGL